MTASPYETPAPDATAEPGATTAAVDIDATVDIDAAAVIAPGGVFALLDQYGIIDALGADACDFLHKQLTNDVTQLRPEQAALGGYCSAKGRLLASFVYWRLHGGDQTTGDPAGDGVRLLLAADLRESIQKRLSMFVLRSKVKLSDATPALAVFGLIARRDSAAALRAALGTAFDKLPDAALGRIDSSEGAPDNDGAGGGNGNGLDGGSASDPDGGPDGDRINGAIRHRATLLRLTDVGGCMRFLLVVPREQCERQLATFARTLSRVDPSLWDWLDVNSGEPRITAATQDRFVPQMVNFEALGGVNFRKGCYPGQEVVARSQYRGTVKRRATLGSAAAAQAGEEVFDEADPQQPCGHIVNAAPAPGGGVDCLVELKLSLAADARLHVRAIDGPRLSVRGLPYRLPSLNA